MTLKQLEHRIDDLEKEVARLRAELCSLRPLESVSKTFGMFAEDPQFDEMVRLGREYRDQVNQEGA